MARLAWLTDLHLGFVGPRDIDRLVADVKARAVDGVAITGDIGEAHDVLPYLEHLDEGLRLPLYFVLGNHDFYRGSIPAVRAAARALAAGHPRLRYLGQGEAIELSAGTALVGHDGWADGRLGDFEGSRLALNDYRLIAELSGLSKAERLEVLHRLGDEAASYFRAVLPRALDARPHVLLLTHVPPYREACWHQGRVSDDIGLPHFASRAAGEALSAVMATRPDRRLTVLCGHTHSPGVFRPAPNILVRTGGAEYGAPRIEDVVEV